MTKKSLVLLCCSLLLSSCTFLIYKAYGIKNPGIENEKSLTKFLRKKHLRTDNYVTIKPEHFLLTLKGKGIPDADFFDANGDYLEYRATDSSCNAGVFGFIPTLGTSTVFRKTGLKSLQKEWDKFLSPTGKVLPALPTADFYMFIYWTAWSGRLNKDHVKVWEDSALAHTKAKIHIIKVNMDLQEYWDEKERQKIIDILNKSAKKSANHNSTK
jgi:hypothetical protein